MSNENGLIYRISGPVVTAVGISPRMYEVVRVGDEGLMGEGIELHCCTALSLLEFEVLNGYGYG